MFDPWMFDHVANFEIFLATKAIAKILCREGEELVSYHAHNLMNESDSPALNKQ